MPARLEGMRGVERAIDNAARALATASAVDVGFALGATYPDGTPVAYIAAIQEFGAQIAMPERTQTIYRKVGASGDFLKGGRFVKKRVSNYATDHAVGTHTVTIPPRPFFRTTIAEQSPGWGAQLAGYLRRDDLRASTALAALGALVQGQIQTSIRNWISPPNAASTIRRKGFDHPLVDTGVMLRSVSYTVE